MYRSMLSSVLTPIDNVPVGQHPYINRLLKGVFNTRPPRVIVVPDLDLLKVLEMLQKAPFEPLKLASSKHLTYKTVFSCSHYNFPKVLRYPSPEVRRRRCDSDFCETRIIETGSNEPFWYQGFCTSFFILIKS